MDLSSLSDFSSLGVAQPLVTALAGRGITQPTPIQRATLSDSLAGRDVLGRGRTGSGKTYAFLLPLVARLQDAPRARPLRPRALVLAPTRELVAQIDESLLTLIEGTKLTSATIFGGVKQGAQVAALKRGVDVIVACPGRLLDLRDQGYLSLDDLQVVVIDEADHMADMGFLPMVRRVMDAVPTSAQKMLFSATLDQGVDTLVKRYLHQPVVHEADSAVSPVVAMEHHVLTVENADRRMKALLDLAAAPGKTILFTRTKHGAKKLTKTLIAGGVPAVELHGNLSQNARTRNLDAFGTGRVSTLVATDIAARGIHVDDVALVVHVDPPVEHKAYLHRSGRTARAGKAGTVITMATPEQRAEVRGLMRAAKITPATAAADPGTLAELAPGERVYLDAARAQRIAQPDAPAPEPARSAASTKGRRRGDAAGSRSASATQKGGGRAAPGAGRSGAPARSQGVPAASSGTSRTGRGLRDVSVSRRRGR